jgi:hypothetical protein
MQVENFSMTPDQIIRAFLRVLADESVNFPLNDLSALSQTLTALQDRPISNTALAIKEWCKEHSEVKEAVLARRREVTEVEPPPPGSEEIILKNRYPELIPAIKDRNNVSQQSPQQNES